MVLSDTIIPHYERHALAWDADRRRLGWNDKCWHDRFTQLLSPNAKVLDLGCGGGFPIAANLVAKGFRVTGVDSSPTLIALCQSRFPGQRWVVGDMRSIALCETFDGILAWDSFFHLDCESQRPMFAVFAAHASAGAVLMFNAGPAHGEAIGAYRGDPLYHASLSGEEYRDLLARHGFEVLDHKVEDPLAGGRTAWLGRAGAEVTRVAPSPHQHD